MVAATSAVGKREAPIDVMQCNLQAAAQRLGLEPDLIALLSRINRGSSVELPVRLDNGSQHIFTGHRVQHTDVRGPYLGGVRFHPSVTLEQLSAQAFATTWRCALTNVPFGGAQGGVACDTRKLSVREFESITRKYAAQLQGSIGPYTDVLAPELNAGEKQINWILKELSERQQYAPSSIVGKPLPLGGLHGYDRAVGRGVVVLLKALAIDRGLDLQKMRIAIQGFGKVGANLAIQLAQAGLRIVAVSDSRGAIYAAGGIDICKLLGHKQRTGSVADFPSARCVTNDALLEANCDVLIPAALDCVLAGRNAARIQASIIIEAASIATTTSADAIFIRKGTVVVPDILANAGSAIASHLEWSQNLQQVVWDENRVNCELDIALLRAYKAVTQRAREEKVSLREAAYLIAVERVARTEKLRAA